MKLKHSKIFLLDSIFFYWYLNRFFFFFLLTWGRRHIQNLPGPFFYSYSLNQIKIQRKTFPVYIMNSSISDLWNLCVHLNHICCWYLNEKSTLKDFQQHMFRFRLKIIVMCLVIVMLICCSVLYFCYSCENGDVAKVVRIISIISKVWDNGQLLVLTPKNKRTSVSFLTIFQPCSMSY